MANSIREVLLKTHESAGKYYKVDGLTVFCLDKGKGIPVLCIHGVPTSSFLYRKLIQSLCEKGYRGLCIDLPGLGLSDRPRDFDYNFENFADFLRIAIKVIGISKFHLVVHDIGGPIGFALAAKNKDLILSLTILNTWIDVVNYKKPWVMWPFEKAFLGEAELMAMTAYTWPIMFKLLGILEPNSVSVEEMNVHLDLLKSKDGGKAFLQIMRNFTNTPEFRDLCYMAVQTPPYPIQLLWGEKDPALSFQRYGEEIKRIAHLEEVTLLPSRHFLQEEVWLGIADKLDEIILSSNIG